MNALERPRGLLSRAWLLDSAEEVRQDVVLACHVLMNADLVRRQREVKRKYTCHCVHRGRLGSHTPKSTKRGHAVAPHLE